jgi:thiol-disulfide isomerase/thioredoxin
MRNINLALLLILSTISIFGQIPDNLISIENKEFNNYFFNKGNIPVVKGKILNLTKEEIEITEIKYSIVTPSEQFQISKHCKPNADGSFELKLDCAFPFQQIWIRVGNYYAGIYANTELYIEIDANILKTQKSVKYNGPGIKYLGQDGELNAFMNNQILFKRERQLELMSMIRKAENSTGSYAKSDSLYSLLQELDNQFFKNNPSVFSWLVINERQSDYYSGLCNEYQGKIMPARLFNKILSHKSYLTSNSGMNFYKALFLYIRSNAYNWKEINYGKYSTFSKLETKDKLILDSIVSINKIISQSQPYDTSKYLFLIKQAKLFLHDTLLVDNTLQTIGLLDSMFIQSKSDLLKMKISSKDPNDQELITGTVLRNIQTEWCKKTVLEQYAENMEKIASINKILLDSKPLVSVNQLGQPIAEMPFGAKLYKVDSLEPKTLLANLKSSFANKALIIDFWATWCGPCLHDLPYSKKLHDNAKDLPIEFVYLCTSSNSNIGKWKSKIAEFELGGTHIFLEQNIENELMKLFFAGGFPSYVLINSNGDFKPGAVTQMSNLDRSQLEELIK